MPRAPQSPASAPTRSCRVCGCTDARACAGGCYWFSMDLCSTCAGRKLRGEILEVRLPVKTADGKVLAVIAGLADWPPLLEQLMAIEIQPSAAPIAEISR